MKKLLNAKGRLVKVEDAQVKYFLKRGFTEPEIVADENKSDEKYKEMLNRIDDLDATEVKELASHFGVEYTKKDETVELLKEML